MTRLEEILRRVQHDLGSAHVDFAVVVALAVSVRTEPRFTRDADLAVTVEGDEQAEELVHALQSSGYHIQGSVEQEAVGRLATVRLTAPGEKPTGIVVDLLFASSGIEPEIVSTADPLELLPELTMRVARVGDLIALKILSRDDVRRPQDLADLRLLLEHASDEDLERARHCMRLIESRGYHRGRDLLTHLEQLREELAAG